MAKLSDLPDELVDRIIDFTAIRLLDCPPYPGYVKDHHELDHNGINGIIQRIRPHLEKTESFCYERRWKAENYPPTHQRNSINVPQVSWPEGLPRNPYLALSLVNRTFRRCAQAKLFNNVALDNQWKASLFLQALTTCPSPHRTQGNSTQAKHVVEDSRIEITPLSQEFSMGKGGGSLICDIIRSCPLLENLAIKPTFYFRCQEPILEALASARFIKDFVGFEQTYSECPILQYRVNDVVARLFSQWDFLETIELTDLCGQPLELIGAIPETCLPVFNCALQRIILTKPDLNEMELSGICKGSRQSLRTLKISKPSRKIERTGLCRVLAECIGTDLESLELEVCHDWHVDFPPLYAEDHDDPAKNPGLLDIIFKSSSALRKLKTLSLTGPLIGSEFFTVLPPSLVKLALGYCHHQTPPSTRVLPTAPLVKALSLGEKDKKAEEYSERLLSHQLDFTGDFDSSLQWLPNLKCFSLRDHIVTLDNETRNDIRAIKEPLLARGVCFHTVGDYLLRQEDQMTEVVDQQDEYFDDDDLDDPWQSGRRD
ncbi:hypothetical protein PSTT_13620 [Puccinia striiformis]|uniref:Uncharacterized protein n=1 Tax=Puccinia striiformis TaxID=27350 RepID=A0A2S4UQT8_9BASI|nr:hypothetical protein PSTT_13620 [Puccinia striiformis]